ncbi:hypothetical protein MJG53_003085 [Ovis ammon polii x Ovis aries]|uniref:Uncharacterized protein n=2 Tax=Ovis TaxID=9935 RepID=A0AAD4UG02_OVIAM|nr:hypothetical protein MG293_004270 [Ovis ammon polii]KAI4575155.1 hypothetical protein MJT46_004434 [Ovis ammon polii x Ovis aries]KAI4588677.1 hypothetical protein MJG53_003085 [Ovis ammon polii x Ovis aries]
MPCAKPFNLLPQEHPVEGGDECQQMTEYLQGQLWKQQMSREAAQVPPLKAHTPPHAPSPPPSPCSLSPVLVTTFHARAFDRDRSTSLPYQFFANYLWLLALKAQF